MERVGYHKARGNPKPTLTAILLIRSPTTLPPFVFDRHSPPVSSHVYLIITLIMSKPPLFPQKTASGIAIDPRSLDRVVPESRRADGSYATYHIITLHRID